MSANKLTHQLAYAGARSLATTLWIPEQLEVIRGVVVFTGGQRGCGSSDTRSLVDAPCWRRFGAGLGFAIMGTQFTGSYADAARGPGDALLATLAAYAQKSGHAELLHAPLLLEGFSNGGYFSFTFTSYRPERVIAFCVNKSGFARASFTPEFLAVPGLLIWGSNEPARNVPSVMRALVQQGRAQHALWAELREQGCGHEAGRAELAYAPFFAAMVHARYPASADPRRGPVALHALNEAQGYLGDHSAASATSQLPTIATFAEYPGDAATASWLATEGLALLWRRLAADGCSAEASTGQADAYVRTTSTRRPRLALTSLVPWITLGMLVMRRRRRIAHWLAHARSYSPARAALRQDTSKNAGRSRSSRHAL